MGVNDDKKGVLFTYFNDFDTISYQFIHISFNSDEFARQAFTLHKSAVTP